MLVAAARAVIVVLKRKVDLAGMRVLQPPGSFGLLGGSKPIDRFVHTSVWRSLTAGTIGAIAIDHALHPRSEKMLEFERCSLEASI
ncbi:MAG: hypothetical protein ABI806_18635 [Candidatus Solibacter sp.]